MDGNKGNIFIDTNILVYAYQADEKEKHKIAKKLVEECFEGKKEYFISNQILAEFIFVTKYKKSVPAEESKIKEIVEEINKINSWKKLNYSNKTVEKALKENGKSFWDNLISATMKENNVYTIYTENVKDFSKIDGIKPVNPL
ncbi:MAG: PIN domain-containing protein [Patescibacteria group bacterium]